MEKGTADILVTFCTRVSKISDHDAKITYNALSDILGIDPDSSEFYSMIVSIRSTFIKVLDEMSANQNIDEENKTYIFNDLESVPRIFTIQNMHTVWQNSRIKLSNCTRSMRFLANFNRIYGSNEEIKRSDIDKIENDINLVADSIKDLKASAEVVELLSHYIRSIKAILRLSDCLPADAIWDMAVKLNADLYKSRNKFSENEDTGGAFSKVRKAAADLANICDKVNSAGNSISGLIEKANHIAGFITG